jgi:hypothetical protein
MGVFDRITAPYRITSVAQEYGVNKDIFSVSKLIKVDEEWGGFPADGKITGVYKLSESEVVKLLNNKPPIKCSGSSHCEIETAETTSNLYCVNAHQELDKLITLCIDNVQNEASWTYFLY